MFPREQTAGDGFPSFQDGAFALAFLGLSSLTLALRLLLTFDTQAV